VFLWLAVEADPSFLFFKKLKNNYRI
jgi:putative AlgH/UPF0301 family transcriptional regulator